MSKLIVTRGLPASGKTTWAKNWVNENRSQRARVNRDDIRENLFGLEGYAYDYESEKAVTFAQHAMIRALLKAGRDVVSDDTNLKARFVRELRNIARQNHADFEINDSFLSVDRAVCQARNLYRTGAAHVEPRVIDDMYDRYIAGGIAPILDDPEPTEYGVEAVNWDAVGMRPSAFLWDIDGTLALKGDRDIYDGSKVFLDRTNPDVVALKSALREFHGEDVAHIIMSGRSDEFRQETLDWLDRNHIEYDAVYMRASDDKRPDWQVKLDLFNEHVRNKYWVEGVFDDRNQVVRLWRELGLTCYQIADGDF